MFGNLREMAGLTGLLKDMPRIKAKMEDVRARLSDLLVTAETGGGAVRVTASGDLRITRVEIDPAMLSGLVDSGAEGDRALAEDLVAGAVNAALQKARQAAEREMMEAMSELGIALPPEALSQLGGSVGGMGGMGGMLP